MDAIDQMRAFAAVVETGSFTAAAARLEVTPQLVSKYVKALEDDLEVRLLNRTTRSVSLTAAGRSYHARCTRLIEEFDQLRAAVRNEHEQPRGVLRIAAPATFGELYLAQAVDRFLAAYPDVSIDLSLNDRFVALVEDGFDMAIRIGSLDDSSLVARRLAGACVVACAAPGYLDRAGRPSVPEDLQHHNCIIDANFRSGDLWPFEVAGRPTAVPVSGRLRVNSATLVRELVLQEMGIGMCPSYLVGCDMANGTIEPVLEAFSTLKIGIYALYPPSRHLSAKVRVFIDFMASHLGPAPPWESA